MKLKHIYVTRRDEHKDENRIQKIPKNLTVVTLHIGKNTAYIPEYILKFLYVR
jgi:hypothetical protein